MAKQENDYFPYFVAAGVFGLAYFGVLRPITNALGLTHSAAAQQVTNENTQAGKAVGWNPKFYIDYNGVKKLYTDASVTMLAKTIRAAWGIINDDEEKIYGVFRQLQNQLQLSQLSAKYFDLYQEDLYSRLTAPWYKGNDGLEPDEFNIIAKIVNVLPVNS